MATQAELAGHLPPMTPAARRRSLAAVIACVAIYGITTGLTQPLLALILESRGTGRSVIGLVSAMPAIAMIVFAPHLPRVVAAVGMRPFLAVCIVGDAALFLLLPVFDSVTAWLLLRCLMGFTVAGLFIASETWINEVATDDIRGRVSGLYNTILAGSLALGPLVIPITGIEGWAPFLVGAGLVLLAAIPLAWARDAMPRLQGKAAFSIGRFVFIAPVLCCAIALMAWKDSVLMSLLPVYGVSSGLSPPTAAVMLTVLGAGALCMQMPIGWLADRLDRYRLLMACAAGGLAGALLLPLAVHAGAWLWPVLFFWGGLFAGIYTLAMAIVGQRFRGPDLVTANAAFGLLWGVGSLLGPPAAGAAMDLQGPNGLVLALALAVLAFLALARWRRGRR